MDPHSEDRSNASNRRELVERTQRRIERKEAEALRQEKLRKRKEKISRIRERLYSVHKREVDLANRTDIIYSDTSGLLEMEKWHPYFDLPRFSRLTTSLKGASWAVEELALQVAPSVVGLQSVTDGNTWHFTCCGTIVESSGELHKIVTVANLVKKCPETDELAKGLTITVNLPNREKCAGHLLYHNFFYNICVIEIQYPLHLPKQGFTSNIDAINFDESWSRDVVTLGRGRETHALLITRGKIIPKCSSFECEELLVSSCKISKIDDESSAKASCLSKGDIINQVNGVYFSNAVELGCILLDICTACLSDDQNFKQLDGSDKMVVCLKFGVRGRQGERTVVVDKLASSGANRWPFPKPIIVQRYREGEKVSEEWYAAES